MLPSSYTAASTADLIADIKAANKAGGTNTITLAANTTFDLTVVDNTTDGANGLPVIGGKNADSLTIIGNGDTIQRSTNSGTPSFRLFDVASGSSLNLQNLTLANGLAYGSGAAADGGAIYNQGTLTLSAVMVENNTAEGNVVNGTRNTFPTGQDAAGGGIWSNGSLTLANGTMLADNSANGGDIYSQQGKGGNAFGGGLYVAGGTATISNTTFYFNQAQGGAGGGPSTYAGNGYGGVVYVAGGQASLTAATLMNNKAWGGPVGVVPSGQSFAPGAGAGGGLYVAGGSVSLSNSYLHFNEAFVGVIPHGFSQLPETVYGGGVYAAAGTLSLSNDTITSNSIWGEIGTAGDMLSYYVAGYGGGIYIAPGATAYIDSFTVSNTINNTANVDPNIHGTYIVLP
jgi:hypothetical protein